MIHHNTILLFAFGVVTKGYSKALVLKENIERESMCAVKFERRKKKNDWAVMRGYQEVRLVMVLLDVGQTLSNELSFHFLTTNDNLHPGLQVKNAAICLHAMKKKLDALVLFRLIKKSDRDTISCSLPAACENFLGCSILPP